MTWFHRNQDVPWRAILGLKPTTSPGSAHCSGVQGLDVWPPWPHPFHSLPASAIWFNSFPEILFKVFVRQCRGTAMFVGTRHFTTWPLWFRCEDKVSILKAIGGFYVLLPLYQIWFYGFLTLASALIPQDLKAWPLSASCSVIKRRNWHKQETILKNI